MKLFKHKLCILLFSIVIVIQIYNIVSYASIRLNNFNSDTILSESTLNCTNYDYVDTPCDLNPEELEVLTLINNYRVSNNESKLIPLSPLQDIAYIKAYDLINNNYFSHTSPNFGSTFSLLDDQKILYNISGENLAGNTCGDKAVTAWINSQSHRENILTNDFKYTGIAIVNSNKYGKIFVQIFIG